MSVEGSATAELRRSFTWRVLAAATGLVSALLLSVVTVRALDAREAATFFAVLAALSVGPLVGRLGLGPNVIRLVAAEADPEARRQIAGAHLRATFLLSSLSSPVIALIGCNGLIGHSNFVPAFLITSALILIESTRLMISDIFAATGKVAASVATMHYVRSFLTLLFVVIVVFAVGRPSLVAVLATYLAAAFIQFVVALRHARTDIAIFRFSGGLSSTLRNTLGQGTQLFSLEFSQFMMMQGTVWLATTAFSSEEATQYAVAVTLGMQVTLLEGLISLAIIPPAARLWAAGHRAQVVRMLSNAATLTTVVIVVVVAMLAVFGAFAIEVAYGAAMRPASTMLLILAAGGIFQAMFAVNIAILIVSGNVAATARTAVVVLCVSLPCAIAAAVFGGHLALAIVTSLSVAAMAICQWLTARRTLGLAPRAHHHLIRAVRELRSDPQDEAEPANPRAEADHVS